jgi:hypothetical protein
MGIIIMREFRGRRLFCGIVVEAAGTMLRSRKLLLLYVT